MMSVEHVIDSGQIAQYFCTGLWHVICKNHYLVLSGESLEKLACIWPQEYFCHALVKMGMQEGLVAVNHKSISFGGGLSQVRGGTSGEGLQHLVVLLQLDFIQVQIYRILLKQTVKGNIDVVLFLLNPCLEQGKMVGKFGGNFEQVGHSSPDENNSCREFLFDVNVQNCDLILQFCKAGLSVVGQFIMLFFEQTKNVHIYSKKGVDELTEDVLMGPEQLIGQQINCKDHSLVLKKDELTNFLLDPIHHKHFIQMRNVVNQHKPTLVCDPLVAQYIQLQAGKHSLAVLLLDRVHLDASQQVHQYLAVKTQLVTVTKFRIYGTWVLLLRQLVTRRQSYLSTVRFVPGSALHQT